MAIRTAQELRDAAASLLTDSGPDYDIDPSEVGALVVDIVDSVPALGLTAAQATDLAGALLATLGEFSYDASSDSLALDLSTLAGDRSLVRQLYAATDTIDSTAERRVGDFIVKNDNDVVYWISIVEGLQSATAFVAGDDIRAARSGAPAHKFNGVALYSNAAGHFLLRPDSTTDLGIDVWEVASAELFASIAARFLPTVSEAEAVAGTSLQRRIWTPHRVKEAVDALAVEGIRTFEIIPDGESLPAVGNRDNEKFLFHQGVFYRRGEVEVAQAFSFTSGSYDLRVQLHGVQRHVTGQFISNPNGNFWAFYYYANRTQLVLSIKRSAYRTAKGSNEANNDSLTATVTTEEDTPRTANVVMVYTGDTQTLENDSYLVFYGPAGITANLTSALNRQAVRVSLARGGAAFMETPVNTAGWVEFHTEDSKRNAASLPPPAPSLANRVHKVNEAGDAYEVGLVGLDSLHAQATSRMAPSLTGEAGKFLRVNAKADAVEVDDGVLRQWTEGASQATLATTSLGSGSNWRGLQVTSAAATADNWVLVEYRGFRVNGKAVTHGYALYSIADMVRDSVTRLGYSINKARYGSAAPAGDTAGPVVLERHTNVGSGRSTLQLRPINAATGPNWYLPAGAYVKITALTTATAAERELLRVLSSAHTDQKPQKATIPKFELQWEQRLQTNDTNENRIGSTAAHVIEDDPGVTYLLEAVPRTNAGTNAGTASITVRGSTLADADGRYKAVGWTDRDSYEQYSFYTNANRQLLVRIAGSGFNVDADIRILKLVMG